MTPDLSYRLPPRFKLRFSFRIDYSENAYDFSKDLSTVVYARPSGWADFLPPEISVAPLAITSKLRGV
jgi:hypothetical protein